MCQSIYPTSKAQQLDVPEVHIARFSPCGQYLVCFSGGFTQLVVYRYTGPRPGCVRGEGEGEGEAGVEELAARLRSFSSFFALAYRLPIAPAGEVLARDVVLFLAGGTQLLLASHTPLAPQQHQPHPNPPHPPAQPHPPAAQLQPPPGPLQAPTLHAVSPGAHAAHAHASGPDADLLASLPAADVISLHVVRLADGARLGATRLEGECVDLGAGGGLGGGGGGGGRADTLGISAHEDLVAVLALRSQCVHLLQAVRGGGELVPVRCLGHQVQEDDELVLRTAAEAEERWLRAQRNRDRQGAQAHGGPLPQGDEVATLGAGHSAAAPSAAAPHPHSHPALPPMRRSLNGDLVRGEPLPHHHPPAGAAMGAASQPPPGLPRGPSAAALAQADGGPGTGGGAAAAAAPVAVLHPPPRPHPRPRPPGPAPAAADMLSLAAQQAAARAASRQQQQEAAQAGPRAPPARRSSPGGGSGAMLPPTYHPGAAPGPGLPPLPHAAHAPHAQHVQPQQPDQAGEGAEGELTGAGEWPLASSLSCAPCITGIKQRLLSYLHRTVIAVHGRNPRRQQREALVLYRNMDMYRSLVIRKAQLLDRHHLLLDMRTPAAAELNPGGGPGGGGGAGGSGGAGGGGLAGQYFLLFDMQANRVISFKPSLAQVLEPYAREAAAASPGPWQEPLPLWDRFTYDNMLTATLSRLQPSARLSTSGAATVPDMPGASSATASSSSAAAGGGGAAADRGSAARKLAQLLPPHTGSYGLSTSPYLDTSLYSYDDRVITPYIRTRPSMEQPISFRPRSGARPNGAASERGGFRLEPGAYEAMVVRDRRLARNVTHLFHPYEPFVLTVFSVFQQNSININYRI